MDISIACSDRSSSTELEPRQAAAARLVVAVTLTASADVVDSGIRATVLDPFASIDLEVSAAAPPIVFEEKAAHRDTTYGSHASGSCSSAA
jgi:hypothetical protein